MPPALGVTLRPGRPADAIACGQIGYEAFTAISRAHHFPPDFPDAAATIGLARMLLAHPAIYSVVAERDGQVVGSNFLWEQNPIAGVGPITVDLTAQNNSIGRRLMTDVLRRAAERKFAGVRLVQAGFHCRSLSLYAKLGFEVREPLACIQGPALALTLPGRTVRAATTADVAACNAVCDAVHGHVRDGELADALAQGTATVVQHAGVISGYATSLGFFGHAVGRTTDDLKALIAGTPPSPGPGFLLPTRQAELFRWCLAQGLRVTQPMTLMTRGFYREPAGAFLPSILY